MSATLIGTEEVSVATTNGADNQRKADAMRRMISRGQGRFVFAPVEFDLPSLQNEALGKLRESLPDLNIVTVKLSPPPLDAPRALTVLDQLEDLVNLHSPDKAPDALIITGYETLFADAIADESKPSYNLRRAIQPLNLGRNIFAEKFPCPVLLCLPPDAMGVFLRSAPDLVSWRSGYYKFESDLKAKRAELQQAARAGTGWLTQWRMRWRKPEDLLAEIKRLESLIADAEALPADKTLIARLYHRLGWTAVALRDRLQARWAFAEALRLAREINNRRLIGAAAKGQQTADRVKGVARVSPTQSTALQEIFRGAAALTEIEGLYGREDELRDLISRVTFVGTRFLTVWGETGSGKTSLVLAGLLPELKRLGHYLPVIIRQWDEPETNIRRALEQTSGSELTLESFPTLHDCVQHIAEKTQNTVVVACDQFEQFFTAHSLRSERLSLLKAVGECVNDLRIPCKFIFIVREDQLGRMVEFENEVPEPLEQRKRFHLPLFSVANAIRVLRLQADRAGLDWPEVFVRVVVNDLIRDERVRPIELQLVGAALTVSGINNELKYMRAGRAQELINDYIYLALNNLWQGKRLAKKVKRFLLAILVAPLPRILWDRDRWDQRNQMRRVLLALVAEPAGRLSLTPDEIARRIGYKLATVLPLLELLVQSHLVRRVDESSSAERLTDGATIRYELTHDILVGIMPKYLLDNRQWAARVLTRALENVALNPRHTISLYDCKLLKENCDEGILADPEVKALIRRSRLVGILKWRMNKWLLLFVAYLALIFYVLPPEMKGSLLLTVGLKKTGTNILLGALKSNDLTVRYKAALEVERRVLSNPRLATDSFQPLLAMLKDRDVNLRWAAADALGRAVQADPTLAGQTLQPLLMALKESDDSFGVVRFFTTLSLHRVAEANPQTSLQPLLAVINDSDVDVRRAATSALGNVAKADHTLASQTLQPLLTSLRDGDANVRFSTASALGQVVQSDHSLANQMLNPLLDTLKDNASFVRGAAARALGQVARVEVKVRSQVFRLLTDYDSNVRDGARDSMADLFFDLAATENKNGRDPVEFLFDHLEGRLSLMPNGDVNTHTAYSDVIVGAMARWLVSDKPEFRSTQEALKQRLRRMRDQDKRLHLRIAAGNVFNEVSELRSQTWP